MCCNLSFISHDSRLNKWGAQNHTRKEEKLEGGLQSTTLLQEPRGHPSCQKPQEKKIGGRLQKCNWGCRQKMLRYARERNINPSKGYNNIDGMPFILLFFHPNQRWSEIWWWVDVHFSLPKTPWRKRENQWKTENSSWNIRAHACDEGKEGNYGWLEKMSLKFHLWDWCDQSYWNISGDKEKRNFGFGLTASQIQQQMSERNIFLQVIILINRVCMAARYFGAHK